MSDKAYFKSGHPQMLHAPGGVVRWQLFQDGDGFAGLYEASNAAQIRFLRECVQNKTGGAIQELTPDQFAEELGKFKGRSVVQDREALTPAGLRGGQIRPPVVVPSDAGESLPEAVAAASSTPEKPVIKTRRDVRGSQDPNP